MKQIVIVAVLTGLWMVASLPGASAGSNGSDTTQSEARSSALASALEQTLDRVESKSPSVQPAPAEIARLPHVIPLSGPVAPSMTGTPSGSSAASVSVSVPSHQEPPFYVNPLSQTVRQVRDLVNGMSGSKRDKETAVNGQPAHQQTGSVPVKSSTAR